ncbi:3-phosphoshikimate 1-carboxyvinyltransferase [Ruoffia tabacinasalis]|uniref:3-phosphoshikimate 1-carboxyvinyltransferase n=1 Tax=Ruoffia tabacinasalis TaxID=87458 RepID=A0ABS0LLA4_9LACT|nr:3-phosphoshikimate 1-carboxyvinyltransferase [Ruoffia tabacinasalis]MBG9978919.1 3-phosphoshikimate 1-carboxyvinyltransferase [Ruoffia tabacinasalis]
MAKRLKGSLKNIQFQLSVPGDKSISHRAIIMGSIAEGMTKVTGFLRSEDCLNTLQIMRQLGVEIDDDGDTVIIHGKGIKQLQEPGKPLYAGNSGTTMRLLSGLLAGQNFKSTLIGDESLSQRPMDRIINPLKSMGANIQGFANTTLPPLIIEPVEKLKAIKYEMPVASAQVKSAILLAGLLSEGVTTIIEKETTRNHTEEMLEQFGVSLNIKGKTIMLEGGQQLIGQDIDVPGDISSAAYFIAAGLLLPNSNIEIKNVGINNTRSGILDVVKAMGGKVFVNILPNHYSADISIETSQLLSTSISGSIIPRLIDEIPVIALLATQAQGTTIIKDAHELRVKETDRIQAVAKELRKMNANIEETHDGLIIHGSTPLKGAKVNSYGDHRIGMMLQIAGLLIPANETIELEDADCVNISYPTFFDEIERMSQTEKTDKN